MRIARAEREHGRGPQHTVQRSNSPRRLRLQQRGRWAGASVKCDASGGLSGLRRLPDPCARLLARSDGAKANENATRRSAFKLSTLDSLRASPHERLANGLCASAQLERRSTRARRLSPAVVSSGAVRRTAAETRDGAARRRVTPATADGAAIARLSPTAARSDAARWAACSARAAARGTTGPARSRCCSIASARRSRICCNTSSSASPRRQRS